MKANIAMLGFRTQASLSSDKAHQHGKWEIRPAVPPRLPLIKHENGENNPYSFPIRRLSCLSMCVYFSASQKIIEEKAVNVAPPSESNGSGAAAEYGSKRRRVGRDAAGGGAHRRITSQQATSNAPVNICVM